MKKSSAQYQEYKQNDVTEKLLRKQQSLNSSTNSTPKIFSKQALGKAKHRASKGVIHIRTKGDGKGLGKCVRLRTRGEGGFRGYVRTQKNFFFNHKISKLLILVQKLLRLLFTVVYRSVNRPQAINRNHCIANKEGLKESYTKFNKSKPGPSYQWKLLY